MRLPLTTLCYLEKDDHYLMLHRIKKEEDLSRGKWLGLGGHLEEGESPDECVVREVYEESGLTLHSYTYRGIVTFTHNRLGTEYMSIFTSDDFSGELQEDCHEGYLAWQSKADLDQLPMWEGDYLFFELLERRLPFFSLKIIYQDDDLQSAYLGQEKIYCKDDPEVLATFRSRR